MKRGRLPARLELVHDPSLLTSEQVVARTGISYRQLDYWTRRGWFSPVEGSGQGKGNPRRWYPEILEEVADLLERISDCPYDHGAAQE